jgi:Transglycosylase SLT domain
MMGYVDAHKVGNDPALLLDPEINITLATKYLIKCVKKVNGFQKSGPDPQMSINDLNLYIQLGFAGYNSGLKEEKASEPNYNFDYRRNVLSNAKKYPIIFKNEIL